jgi:hypothetical protein
MKNSAFFQLMPVVFCLLFVNISTLMAADITLSGQVENGYYVTDTNVVTAENNCTIPTGNYALCVVEGTTTLNPGFSVENGAVFGVFPGQPSDADIPENFDYDQDGLPDYWELQYLISAYGSIECSECGHDGNPDGDHMLNYDEYLNGTDPMAYNQSGIEYEYDVLGRITRIIRNP